MAVNQRLKHVRRPKKAPADKVRRQKTQKKRLVTLGMSEEVVAVMPADKVRKMVQRPAKVRKAVAKAAAKA